MRIATFNLQNMRLRADHLDGARDGDVAADRSFGAKALDGDDRALTAQVIAEADADLLAVQEVFDQRTLDHFHDQSLLPLGVTYPHRYCFPGNDGRGLDIGVLSKHPLSEVQSHADLTPDDLDLSFDGLPDDLPIFRRDVLRVKFAGLTLFICHFKAPYPDNDQTWATRAAEAQALRRLVERHFKAPSKALWMILGDLNEPAEDVHPKAIPLLLDGFAIDLVQRLSKGQRWSWHNPETDQYGHPDAMLASPALAQRWPDALPDVIRSGMGLEATRNEGPHLPLVGQHRPHASDHAAVAITLPGLLPKP